MYHRRFNAQSLYVADPDEPEPEPISEAGPASPSSEFHVHDRREMKKRVVTIPIGDVDGSKSKGETYPPSDSWAWRKYGQKPIKGSPYPRSLLELEVHGGIVEDRGRRRRRKTGLGRLC
ncbi:WRKY domain [Sesbania bispinosa]|nr:WRKY domain [Sesbania bispinosa]